MGCARILRGPRPAKRRPLYVGLEPEGRALVDRNRPARYAIGDRAALKATGQPVQILEVRRGEFVPDFVYKVRVLAERPARPYNLSVPEHDLSDQ
jgi:hypothetical protein